jgi:hypothetical protein
VRATRKIRWIAIVSVAALTVPATSAAAALDDPWQFDGPVVTKSSDELTGVRVLSGTEAWVVGTETDPVTGHTGGLLGRWDGDALNLLTTSDADEAVELADVDVVGDDVWTVGRTAHSNGTVQARIERHSRTDIGSGIVLPSLAPTLWSELGGIDLLSSTDGWAVGSIGSDSLILHWDGVAWTRMRSPSPGTLDNRLYAVAALAPDDVWAVGRSSKRDDRLITNTLVLHWNGLAWTQVPSPNPVLLGVNELLGVAVTRESVWAVGYTSSPDNKRENRQAVALRWDHSTWQVLRPNGIEPTQFNDATALSNTDVWIAGYSLVDLTETAHIEHWDGIQLQPGAILTNEYPATALNAISAPPNGPLCAVGWLAPTPSANHNATILRKPAPTPPGYPDNLTPAERSKDRPLRGLS